MSAQEGGAKTLFNGVSRQGDHMRLPNQVQDAQNLVMSIVTGGVAMRSGSEMLKSFTGISAGVDRGIHFINRDASERYTIVHSGGAIRVFSNLDGSEKTVNYTGSAATYLAGANPTSDYVFVSIADYTMILNRTKTVAMRSDTFATAGPPSAVLTVKQSQGVTKIYIADANYSGAQTITVTQPPKRKKYDASYTPTTDTMAGFLAASYTPVVSDTPAVTAAGIAALLTTNIGANYNITVVDNYIMLRRKDNGPFTITKSDGGGFVDLVSDTTDTASKLPAIALQDMVVKILGPQDTGFYLRFFDIGGNRGVWRETAKPGVPIRIDASTMPHTMVRNADGTFTVKPVDWSPRIVGDQTTSPDPFFVEKVINEMSFHRNRLVLAAGEVTVFSAAGDYWNYWPELTTQVLDSDPFALSAPGTQVANVRFAVPFRRSLFVASSTAQFEISSPDILTPTKAAINPATAYQISPEARPVVAGDSLFMAATVSDHAAILELVYDAVNETNTAIEVTRHLPGYIPSPVTNMATDSVSNALFFYSPTLPSTLFVHNFFWVGNEKQQSAFHKWTFNLDAIWGFSASSGVLYVVGSRGGATYILKVSIDLKRDTDYAMRSCLDFSGAYYGTYDPVADETAFTLPFDITGLANWAAVPSVAAGAVGIPAIYTKPADTTHVYCAGNLTAGPVIVGCPFDAYVTLSKPYVRNGDGSAILEGRLQLKRFTLKYKDSGNFKVLVTPTARPTRALQMTSRLIGAPGHLAGVHPIVDGRYAFTVNSNAETCAITVTNDGSHIPFGIVATSWVGSYASTTRP